MKYYTPELRRLGSFATLTMGQGGSCPDGNGNVTQVGGGSVGGDPQKDGCGESG